MSNSSEEFNWWLSTDGQGYTPDSGTAVAVFEWPFDGRAESARGGPLPEVTTDFDYTTNSGSDPELVIAETVAMHKRHGFAKYVLAGSVAIGYELLRRRNSGPRGRHVRR
jgi:hypothetical protein